MNETKTMEILKLAILLERRGKSFYQKVAEQTDNKAVKSFFGFMAEEEQKHMNILAKQLKAYKEKGVFTAGTFDKNEMSQVSSQVIDNEIKDKIAAAGFEAAAIGASIGMEERAMKVYAERAASATDPEEKNLYKWLSDWERQHLNQLLDMDKDLMNKVWFDNQFWPY